MLLIPAEHYTTGHDDDPMQLNVGKKISRIVGPSVVCVGLRIRLKVLSRIGFSRATKHEIYSRLTVVQCAGGSRLKMYNFNHSRVNKFAYDVNERRSLIVNRKQSLCAQSSRSEFLLCVLNILFEVTEKSPWGFFLCILNSLIEVTEKSYVYLFVYFVVEFCVLHLRN